VSSGYDLDLEHSSMTEDERIEFELLQRPNPSMSSMASMTWKSTTSQPQPKPKSRAVAKPHLDAATLYADLTMATRLEEAYAEHRATALKKDQFDTPLAVLHALAGQYVDQAEVHYEVHEVRKSDEPVRFVVEVFVGNRKGD
jgi:hypothetical protein